MSTTSVPEPEGDPHDSSRSETPMASRLNHPLPMLPTVPKDQRPDPLNQPPSSTSHMTQFSLPISPLSSSRSQTSFTLLDVLKGVDGFEPLTPEIASADVSLASDGTFIETSVGPAARELKKFYDQRLGVSASIRSPYAITAFVNQHGKQMFRIGHRDLSAPAAAALEAEDLASHARLILESKPPPSALDDPQTTRTKRRSRLSMHVLLPQSMFKNGSTPPARAGQGQPHAGPHRKLRRTRSIPDMFGFTTTSTPPSAFPALGQYAGRAHSHSVTGAETDRFPIAPSDALPPPLPIGDMFNEVLNWGTSTAFGAQSTPSLSSPAEGSATHSLIANPFGPGVTFDSPSARPHTDFLPSPAPVLREVQSFESGLTARQVDPEQAKSPKEHSPSPEPTPDPPSRIPSVASMKKLVPQKPVEEEPVFGPSPQTSMLSRYSTDVFDVLQTYRGLPLLDKLSPDAAETTVIKLSLSAGDTAAPRDDPRFVIWGEIVSDHDLDDFSISQGDLSSSTHSSTASRKRLTKGPPPDLPTLRISPGQETQKAVVAATIERWIAQLTSELNYDELLNFFLTYRTYITAIDLCHLLICRFHWALMQRGSSWHDEMVRRIVRVRTFVAIRYWLLTFFVEDFVPNRELRLLVAHWLNTLAKDPILKRHKEGQSIVQKMVKVAKDCKKTHAPTRKATISKRRVSVKPSSKTAQLLGEKFAEATAAMEDESDVDLDFLADETARSTRATTAGSAHLSTAISPTAPISLSALAMLQQTARGTESEVPHTPPSLPSQQNPISRAFVNTMGRLGRWKRVLNARSTVRAPLPLAPCTNLSAFDLDLNRVENLMALDDDMDVYERMRQLGPDLLPVLDIKRQSIAQAADTVPAVPASTAPRKPALEASNLLGTDTVPSGEEPDQTSMSIRRTTATTSSTRASIRTTSSTDSLGVPLSPRSRAINTLVAPSPASPWQFDIVSIDDLDLSDTSSGHEILGPSVPPGLKKQGRKLPLRRDFEFVRRSESAASASLHVRDSIASHRTDSMASTSSADLGGTIQPWQVNALIDSLSNDDEGGDVESALRRLEGQIHPKKVQENKSKVDGWVRTIQQRLVAGDYSNEAPMSDDEDGAEGQNSGDARRESSGPGREDHDDREDTPSLSSSISQPEELTVPDNVEMATTPVATHMTHPIFVSTSPVRGSEPNAIPDDVASVELLHNMSSPRVTMIEPRIQSITSKFANPEVPQTHRSFILGYRAQTLVEQLSIIDRDLFMGVKFEELFLGDWTFSEDMDVLDWTQFLKDRTQWKSESLWPQRTSALAAVRARFNLLANFTISEVVLTQPNERALVVGKFIRIAWKAYCLNNFNTLVAIVAGLQNELVNKAMRRSWNRVGMWETRVFNDLKVYTSSGDDFLYIRRAVDAIADAKPLDVSSRAASIISVGGTDSKGRAHSDPKLSNPSACIPFIGIYLSQLRRHGQLPDLIDPTAPNEAVGVDPITSNFDAPAHPEVFSALEPLPPSIQLEPLINVHKQRLIAGVIKNLVGGQHLASRVELPMDKKIFQKCLKLRALDRDTLRRALSTYPD